MVPIHAVFHLAVVVLAREGVLTFGSHELVVFRLVLHVVSACGWLEATNFTLCDLAEVCIALHELLRQVLSLISEILRKAVPIVEYLSIDVLHGFLDDVNAVLHVEPRAFSFVTRHLADVLRYIIS